MALVLGVVVFTCMALCVLALDVSGVLASINSLLGSSISRFTPATLYTLSLLFAMAVMFAYFICAVIWAMLANGALALIGGVDVAVNNDTGEAAMSAKPTRRVVQSNGARVMHSHE